MSNANRDLVERAFGRWEGGEFAAVSDLMADELEWTIIGSTDVSRTYHGRADFLDTVNGRLFRRLDGPLRVKIERIIADGAHVAVQFRSHATTRSGLAYDQAYCWVLELADGRIRRGTAYLDTALLARVLAEDLAS